MTARLDYLKQCIVAQTPITKSRWYFGGFAIPVLKDVPLTGDSLDLITKADGLYYLTKDYTGNLTAARLDDAPKNAPLFSFQEEITVDETWLPTIPGKITTKIGVLIVNALVLYPSVGTKLPYVNRTITVPLIESMLVNAVKNDDVATPKDVTVKELVTCIDRLTFLSSLANIVSIASTPKTITSPPGLEVAKKALFKEYADQFDNPVKVVELENKLAKLDEDYLADDPAAKKILSKKSKTARKKTLLIYGETNDFVTTPESRLVRRSLSEGVDVTPEHFPLYMNDLRYGSFARGSSTALSGYSYKILQRSLSGLTISPTPCDTQRGLFRRITKDNCGKLVNRYVKEKGWVLIDTLAAAQQYIGQTVEMRSAMYCTAPGNTLCYACMSENYKNTPSGVTNLAANISSVLMSQFLKLTHGTITETTPIDLVDLIT